MNRGARVARFAVFAAAAAAALSFVVMSLWNWLMPAIFGLRTITYWQGLGLLALSKILLGGFRGGPGRHLFWRRRMMERWEKMTPEEREKFRQGMRGGCGPFGPAMTDRKD
jgi:hypothetical protein